MAAAAETLDKNTYIPADSISLIAAARQEVRAEAWAMVHLRAEQIANGKEVHVPLAIDALSTGDKVLEAEAEYGQDSAEYRDVLAGLDQDCLRLTAEWYRKLKGEYFAPVRHFFNAQVGDFFSHGLSSRQMTENALRPIPDDPEEVGRRVNERVEDETPLIIKKLGGAALRGAKMRTVSECTDKAIRDYQHDQQTGAPHRGYGGYVPEIEKVVFRDTWTDAETGDRWQEQLALNGIIMNGYVIREAIRRRRAEVGDMDKTELHATQLLVEDDLIEDFLPLLDQVASEAWCVDIFMGEVLKPGQVKDYSRIREEAMRRQAGLTDIALTVRNYVLDLARDGFDRRKAPAKIELFVKLQLLHLAKQQIDLTEQMFDKTTAIGLRQVIHLEALGRFDESNDLFNRIFAAAPGGGYCNGGSCGLEAVHVRSKEGQELSGKLKAKPGDTIVKDKERSCKCGSKSVAYAYNKTKVNKYCENCSAFESKVTKAA